MKKTILVSELEPDDEGLAHSSSTQKSDLNLQQAIDFGEYDPEVLANFAEWHSLSPHIQWQLIRKALDIRRKQLITQYAELNNVLHMSKKPDVQEAIKSVEKQIQYLMDDREQLYIVYSNRMT